MAIWIVIEPAYKNISRDTPNHRLLSSLLWRSSTSLKLLRNKTSRRLRGGLSCIALTLLLSRQRQFFNTSINQLINQLFGCCQNIVFAFKAIKNRRKFNRKRAIGATIKWIRFSRLHQCSMAFEIGRQMATLWLNNCHLIKCNLLRSHLASAWQIGLDRTHSPVNK